MVSKDRLRAAVNDKDMNMNMNMIHCHDNITELKLKTSKLSQK